MTNFRHNEPEKARLFRGLISPEEAGLLPICDADTDWRKQPALQGAELRAFWERMFDNDAMDLDNSSQDRLLAAWRLTRSLGKIRGVLQRGDPIELVIRDPAVNNSEFTSYVEVRDAWLRSLLASGVAMMPPEMPKTMLLTSGAVSDDYRPKRDDPALVRFVELVTYVGQGVLALDQSAKARRGFVWFTSLDLVRAGWPSAPVLSNFESKLISETIEILLEHTDNQARGEIAAKWDLTSDEVEQLCSLAKRAMADRQQFEDREGNKALVLARLDMLMSKATDALDHRGAAMMQQQWWRIYDSRGEQDQVDEFEDMTSVLTVSAASKRRSLPLPKDTK